MKVKINGEELYMNQQEYLNMLGETEEVDGLPRRKYEIEVLDMNATEPPKPLTEEEKKEAADEEAFVVRVGKEFEQLDEIFNATLENMTKKASDRGEEFPNLVEAAMNASTAIYMHAKK